MAVHQLLHITKHVCITPLVEIHTPTFQESYRAGVFWCHHGCEGDGPLDDRYLADRLLYDMNHGAYFDGQHDDKLLKNIGFFLGMIHGGVLLPDGTVRRDMTALVTLHDRQTRCGYGAGRSYYFLDAETDEERDLTDVQLIERLKRDALEHMRTHESVKTWYFIIGCILGGLSGQVFQGKNTALLKQKASKQLAMSAISHKDV